MPVYFEYALKVSICLAVVFLFYNLLLKRMTYYTWNRYFLLFFSTLSFIVPFINVTVFVQAQQTIPASIINQVPSINSFEVIDEGATNPGAFSYWQVLFLIIVLVSFILILRLIVQLVSIKNISSRAPLLSGGEVKIYQHPDPIIPFSFYNSIFINTTNYSSNEIAKIIDHETVHVQQRHTIDVLMTEIIFILNWYNPFAWLIKQAVRENLEFIADDAVIKNGIDKKNYQYLLLKVTGDVPSAIICSLKFSTLKNRIFMMNKSKTSRFHLLKFALLIPMITFLLLAFRNNKEVEPASVQTENIGGETYTLSTLTYSIADEKVKSIVLQNNNKSLLKPGEILNLALIYNEKDRLKNLLEKSVYKNLKSNAIRFMIDTTLVNKNFSIEVNIDVKPSLASDIKKDITSSNNKTIDDNFGQKSISDQQRNDKAKSTYTNQFTAPRINSYLKAGDKSNEGC